MNYKKLQIELESPNTVYHLEPKTELTGSLRNMNSITTPKNLYKQGIYHVEFVTYQHHQDGKIFIM